MLTYLVNKQIIVYASDSEPNWVTQEGFDKLSRDTFDGEDEEGIHVFCTITIFVSMWVPVMLE